jgi:hypothetical protein
MWQKSLIAQPVVCWIGELGMGLEIRNNGFALAKKKILLEKECQRMTCTSREIEKL